MILYNTTEMSHMKANIIPHNLKQIPPSKKSPSSVKKFLPSYGNRKFNTVFHILRQLNPIYSCNIHYNLIISLLADLSGSCYGKCGTEFSDSIKFGKFLNQVIEYVIFKDPVP